VRTSLPAAVLDDAATVRGYKSLSLVERAFRCIKTVDLKVWMRASDLAHRWRRCANGSIAIGIEPARFVCDQHGDAVNVSVEFPNDQDGEAFASRFDGQEPQRAPPFTS
jgi:hypothetical protein